MKQIALTKGKITLVDDEDFDFLNQWSWCYNSIKGYVQRSITIVPGKQKTIYLHRVVMNTPEGVLTDHKDHDKLNNQKSNLRICTSIENHRNKCVALNKKSSKFKGVFSLTDRNNYKFWRAMIDLGDQQITKTFPFTPEGELAAAKFYNTTAEKHFGEFALINSTL